MARGSRNGKNTNVLELTAVLLALKHFPPVFAGRRVLIRTDNTSAVYHINHQGSTRSGSSLKLTQQLLSWAYPRLLSLGARHLPSTQNTAADLLSRRQPHPGDWILNLEVVQTIWHQYGKAEVDLFPAQATTQCPRWFSLEEAKGPWGQDALTHGWPRQLLYAFPPLPPIRPTLERILRENHRVLLVALKWQGRSGSRYFTKYWTENLGCLPVRADLLSQLGGQIWHPNPAQLQLWVWPLNGLNHY